MNETAPNWLHLVEHGSKQVNDSKFSKAISWIDHDDTHDRHLPEQIPIPLLPCLENNLKPLQEVTSVLVRKAHTRSLPLRKVASVQMRETQAKQSPTVVREIITQPIPNKANLPSPKPFIYVENIGLRLSTWQRKPS